MPTRVCPTPGCPTLTAGGPCPDHARPNAQGRGYGHAHRKQRASWAQLVQAGGVQCWRPECRRLIRPDESWHLGHDDLDRSITRGPEHVLCNLSAAGRSAHGQ